MPKMEKLYELGSDRSKLLFRPAFEVARSKDWKDCAPLEHSGSPVMSLEDIRDLGFRLQQRRFNTEDAEGLAQLFKVVEDLAQRLAEAEDTIVWLTDPDGGLALALTHIEEGFKAATERFEEIHKRAGEERG